MVYSLKWDSGGLLLFKTVDNDGNQGNKTVKSGKGCSAVLRPVFREELELFNLTEYWDVSKTDNPLLWYNTRSKYYYYRGNKVARQRGGNVREPPTIEVYEKELYLDGKDIDRDVERNKELLLEMEDEAVEFIRDISEDYDIVISAFSGGKDSMVSLYLTVLALENSSKDIQVLYVDTTLESKYTLEYVEEVKRYVESKGVKFNTVKPTVSAYELMLKQGIPTRLKKWCCRKLKLEPVERFYREISEKNNSIVFIEGVRKEESVRRQKYDRISKDKAIKGQIKARPIFDWTTVELWLYIFLKGLPINKLYRYGMNRTGCIFCPFHSGPAEYISSRLDDTQRYWELLEEQLRNVGIEDTEEYIHKGYWKARYTIR